METNPNPILHFNERPGASPDYRFDYVEKNINLGSGAAPVARNKGFTRIETASIPLLRHQVVYKISSFFNDRKYDFYLKWIKSVGTVETLLTPNF